MKNESEKEWFETWFDSRWYHMLYDSRDEQEARDFIERLFHELAPSKDARVLDLACGKGRHAVAVAGLGYEVTGVDLSEQSIAEAKVSEKAGLEFFVHDMRRPFRINYYDVVLNLFTSFGYFRNERENMDVVHAVASALKKNGIFVLDFLNAVKVLRTASEHCCGEKIVDGVAFSWEKKVHEHFIEKMIRVKENGQEYRFSESVQLLRLNDISRMLDQQFTIERICGSYGLDPFVEASSDRLIIIARKK